VSVSVWGLVLGVGRAALLRLPPSQHTHTHPSNRPSLPHPTHPPPPPPPNPPHPPLTPPQYARKGVNLSVEAWLLKLMVGAVDPSYDAEDEA